MTAASEVNFEVNIGMDKFDPINNGSVSHCNLNGDSPCCGQLYQADITNYFGQLEHGVVE